MLLGFIMINEVCENTVGKCLIACSNIYIADPGGRAVKGTGLRPFDCWGRGFGSYRGYGSSPVVFVGFCVGSGLCDELITLCEESYRLCVFPFVCDLETSRMRPARPDLGYCTKEKNLSTSDGYIFWSSSGLYQINVKFDAS